MQMVMETEIAAMDESALLKESDWIGGLAVKLIGNAHEAEDLAQDTRLAALQMPRDRGRPIRPWLATVARNGMRMLRRSEGSRRARESDHAAMGANETARSPAEMLEALETQELVSRFVRELPDELSSVIVESFLEDRTPAEIAALRGIPPGTVRWRKREALRRLRERLETHYGGDRSAWLGALLPLAQHSLRRSAGTATGGVVGFTGPSSLSLSSLWVTTSLMGKLVTMVCLVAISVLALRTMTSGGAAPVAKPTPSLVAATGQVPRVTPPPQTQPHRLLQGAARMAIPTDSGLKSSKLGLPSSAVELTRIVIHVEDSNGRPVAGVKLTPSFSADLERAHRDVLEGMKPLELAKLMSGLTQITDSAGAATWETDLLRVEGVITFRAEGVHGRTGSARLLVRPDGEVYDATIELKATNAIEGRIVHSDGSVPRRQLVFIVAEDSPVLTAETTAFEWIGHEAVVASAHAREGGLFRSSGIPDGRWIALTSELSGFAPVRSAPFEIAGGETLSGIELLVQPDPLGRPEVLVLGSDGEPLLSARVHLTGLDGLSYTGDVNGHGVYGLAGSYGRFAGGTLEVVDTKLLHVPFKLSPIPQGPRTLRVPMEPVKNKVKRTFRLLSNSDRSVTDHHVLISNGDSSQAITGAGSQWTVELPGGAQDSVNFRVSSRGFGTLQIDDLNPSSLAAETELVLTPLPGIAGQVRFGGHRLAGVQVRLYRKLRDGRIGLRGNDVKRLGGEIDIASTDNAGFFRVFTPDAAACVLIASKPGYADLHLDLGNVDPSDPVEDLKLELGNGGTLVGTCTNADGEPANGAMLVLAHPFHRPLRTRSQPDGTFRFTRVPQGDWYLREVGAFESEDLTRIVEPPSEWNYPRNCSIVEGETSTLKLSLDEFLDSTVEGSWTLADPQVAASWSISISQNPLVEGAVPFVGSHEASVEVSSDGSFSLPATTSADAQLWARSKEVSGIFRRSVARTELPLILDVRFGLGKMDLERPVAGTAGAGATRMHVAWNDGDWSFDSYVCLLYTSPSPRDLSTSRMPSSA